MRLVIHNGSRVWGGNEKWLATVASGLRDRGHQVVVSCRDGGPVQRRLAEHGIRTTDVRPGGDLDLFSAVRFAAWLRRERPHAVLATSWNRVTWISWAARWAGVPHLVVRLGVVRSFPRSRWRARPFRRRGVSLIVNSEEIRERWLGTAPGFPADAVHVVHNGIRPVERPPPEFRERFRRELGVAPDAPLVVGVGHVYPRKGFDLLIDAFAAAGLREAHLVIVGSGPQVEELRARAERLGVADRVHWTGFRSDVPEVIGACDLFVLSSRNEGMANVMLEAMAVGTPVVATAVSGVRFALGPSDPGREAGWVVPPEDPAAMTRAVTEVLGALRERPRAVRERVEEAERRVRERFGVERMIDEVERVLWREPA